MGSNQVKNFGNAIHEKFGKAGSLISSQLQALTSNAASSAVTGSHFDAAKVLTDNLGSVIGSSLLETGELMGQNALAEGAIEGVNKVSNKVKIAADIGSISLKTADALKVEQKSERLLGTLSMREETGKKPDQYLLASAVVSSGKNDPGGISYGAYQLSSAAKTVADFLEKEGAVWAKEFEGLDPMKPGAFGDKWKEIAKTQGDAFFRAQHAFIEESHYTPVKSYLRNQTGLDIDKQPAAVKDAVWSAAVQHGGAKFFIADAIKSLGDMDRSSKAYAAALINSIYDKRINYVSNTKLNSKTKNTLIQQRYPDERQRALKMLEK